MKTNKQSISVNELANEPPTDSSNRHSTLKDRIKRAMGATDSSPRRRRASVLDAASALASLGGTPPPPPPLDAAGEKISLPSSPSGDILRGDIPMSFPEKLMEVLSNDQLSNIITWLPHGKGFAIFQKRKFESDVLPHYFKQSKFTSFTRKLNRWGFTRVTSGPEIGAYFHKFFQRGINFLCMQMHCQSSAPSSKGASSGTSDNSPSTTSQDAKSPRSSPSPFAHEDNAMAEDDVSTETPQGQVCESVIPFDLVLHRQRQLLRELQADRHDHSPSLTGQTSVSTETPQGQVYESVIPFDLVLHRQRQLLRESQADSHDHSSSLTGQASGLGRRVFDLQQQLLRTSRRNNANMSQRQPQDMMQQQPRFNEVDQVAQAERLLCNITSSSRRNHRLIIQPALNALKSQNCRADPLPTPTNHYRIGPAQASVNSSSRLQTNLHTTMQARLRQLGEINKTVEDALTNEHHCRLHNEIGQRRDLSRGAQSNSSGHTRPRSSAVRRASAA